MSEVYLVHYHCDERHGKHSGREGAGEVALGSTPGLESSRKKKSHWSWFEH